MGHPIMHEGDGIVFRLGIISDILRRMLVELRTFTIDHTFPSRHINSSLNSAGRVGARAAADRFRFPNTCLLCDSIL